MQETTKIMIYVTERSTTNTEDGKERKFKTYHTFSKNGRRTDVKFVEECDIKPKENCFIEVPYDKMNLNTRDRYPTLWIKEVVATHPISAVVGENNKKKINDFFGDTQGKKADESEKADEE